MNQDDTVTTPVNRPAGKLYRFPAFATIILMGIILFLREWQYGKTGLISGIIFYSLESVGLVFVVVLLAPVKSLSLGVAEKRILKRFGLIYAVFFLTVLLKWLSLDSSEISDSRTYIELMITFLQLPLWVLLGFWFMRNKAEADWFLGTIAALLAIGAVVSYVFVITGFSLSLFAPASWPVRLLFLFGYCWYLSRWIQGKGLAWPALVGIGACSLEIWLPLHKPIIFSAFFATVAVALFSLFRSRLPWRTTKRVLLLAISTTLMLISANTMTGGNLFSHINEVAYTKFLKMGANSYIDTRNLVGVAKQASSGRFDIWGESLNRFRKSPVFGCGFLQNYTSIFEGAGDYLPIHNGFLDLLVSAGLFGFIPILVIFVWWTRRVLRGLRSGPFLAPSIACLSYIIGIMAYNLGGSSILFFSVNIFMALMFGVSLKLSFLSS